MNIRRIIKEEIDNTPYLGDLDKDLARDLWVSNGLPSENFDVSLEWTNEDISKSVYVDGKSVGVYMLGDYGLFDYIDAFKEHNGIIYDFYEDVSKYENKKALNGVFLAVLPEYKGTGVGKMLIDYAIDLKNSSYDYIYGFHDIKFDNESHWTKRRRVIGRHEESGSFITLSD